MNPPAIFALPITRQSPTNKSLIKLLAAKANKASAATLLLSAISGCGSMGAAVSNGPRCPYQGLSWDFAIMTDWTAIKNMFGFNIVLGALDTPFSFVADTLTIPFVDWSEEDLSQCPANSINWASVTFKPSTSTLIKSIK